jgi:LmbE family N-acetylglucosaminyl deacetylase
MRKLAAGTRVDVVIASEGRHSQRSDKVSADALAALREEEARRAGLVLGLLPENIVFLRFEDGRLTDHRWQLRDRLFPIFEQLNPDEIFVSSIIDTHPDHRVLGELGRELARSRRGHYPILYEYPIWFWDPQRWRLRELAELGVRIVLTGEFLANKHEAVAAYRSQVMNLTGEAGWATLRRGFLRQFLQPEEIFFEVDGSVRHRYTKYRNHDETDTLPFLCSFVFISQL